MEIQDENNVKNEVNCVIIELAITAVKLNTELAKECFKDIIKIYEGK